MFYILEVLKDILKKYIDIMANFKIFGTNLLFIQVSFVVLVIAVIMIRKIFGGVYK